MSDIKVSVIIPVLNESNIIVERLEYLKKKVPTETTELIVVDGGSTDNTIDLARQYVDHIVLSEKGRAAQMNAGAKKATGHYLLFLHSDTQLPDNPFHFLNAQCSWGFYTVSLSGASLFFRIIERMINIRSQLTHVATGDQCLFVKKDLFSSLKGFAPIPLMEDVEITKRLKKIAEPFVIQTSVITSSRRWEENGTIKTVILMWYLRALYFFGVSSEKLVKIYYK